MRSLCLIYPLLLGNYWRMFQWGEQWKRSFDQSPSERVAPRSASNRHQVKWKRSPTRTPPLWTAKTTPWRFVLQLPALRSTSSIDENPSSPPPLSPRTPYPSAIHCQQEKRRTPTSGTEVGCYRPCCYRPTYQGLFLPALTSSCWRNGTSCRHTGAHILYRWHAYKSRRKVRTTSS